MMVAVVAIAVVSGCKWRGSASSESEGGGDTGTVEREPDTGGESESRQRPDDKREWAERVRQKLAEAEKTAPADGPTPEAECTLFPDNCGNGESCFVGPSGKRKCAAFNPTKSPGDSCHEADKCNLGQQCVGSDPPVCLETCSPDDLDRWGCPSGRACTPIIGDDGEPFDWGVCRRIEDGCRPWPNDSCAIGEACVKTPVGLRCRSYRAKAEPGDACVDPSDCRIGQVCVVGRAGLGACRSRCDERHPCEQSECRPLAERDFGFCPGDRETAESEGADSPSITGF